jgi:quinoprotein glucose dehydrogenase
MGRTREGDNLYANSLIALDARTGERRWHRQLVRHDMWDRDLPAPPNLVTIRRAGAEIPAVAQVTKTGDTFLFHRETGEPLFPLREEPVVGPFIPGEHPAASQPLPVKPPAFVRQHFSRELVTDYSDASRDEILARLDGMQFRIPLHRARRRGEHRLSRPRWRRRVGAARRGTRRRSCSSSTRTRRPGSSR